MLSVSHNCFYYTSKPECAIPDDNNMLSFSHGVILTWCHSHMVSFSHGVILTRCHSHTVSFSHVVHSLFVVCHRARSRPADGTASSNSGIKTRPGEHVCSSLQVSLVLVVENLYLAWTGVCRVTLAKLHVKFAVGYLKPGLVSLCANVPIAHCSMIWHMAVAIWPTVFPSPRLPIWGILGVLAISASIRLFVVNFREHMKRDSVCGAP
jgi:hypothetical protein